MQIELIQSKQEPQSDKVVSPDFDEQTAYLRDTAKWITTGAVATFAGIVFGATLTNVGTLPTTGQDAYRFWICVGGGVLSCLGISAILYFAINVFTVGVGSVADLARAGPFSPHWNLKKEIEYLYNFDANNWSWELVQTHDAFQVVREHIDAIKGFVYVRRRFFELRRALLLAGPFTLLGAIVFTWAANPPEGFGKPEPVTARAEQTIVEVYGSDGLLESRTITRVEPVPDAAADRSLSSEQTDGE